METSNRDRQKQWGSFTLILLWTQSLTPPSPLQPSPGTKDSKALSPTATYAFLCPLGHDHGFTKWKSTAAWRSTKSKTCGCYRRVGRTTEKKKGKQPSWGMPQETRDTLRRWTGNVDRSPLRRTHLGPDCYRKSLLRQELTQFYVMSFIPKLWLSTLTKELHHDLWLLGRKGVLHSSTSQAASGMELILLSRRMLELETGARQLVLLPLVSMLFTACPLLP